MHNIIPKKPSKTKTPMHQWNKKINSTFKSLNHDSIELHQKKRNCWILNVKSQSINKLI